MTGRIEVRHLKEPGFGYVHRTAVDLKVECEPSVAAREDAVKKLHQAYVDVRDLLGIPFELCDATCPRQELERERDLTAELRRQLAAAIAREEERHPQRREVD